VSESHFEHETVLLNETVDMLNLKSGDIAVDCTIGGGGHTERILRAVGPEGTVIGFDRDEQAVAATTRRLSHYVSTGNLEIIKTEFSAVHTVLAAKGLIGKVAGICADIGVSSPQLDHADRGFSFLREGPLDMRMDPSKGVSAADLLQDLSVDELERIFRDYGEEPKARILAQLVVKARPEAPFRTTLQFANFVEKNLFYPGPSKKHIATKAFQALRIAVNGELEELRNLLDGAFEALLPSGRLAVISFHSLEDRIVKKRFTELAAKASGAISRNLPLTDEELNRRFPLKATIVKPFPVVASEEDQRKNPRARSAKLRVLEKR